MSNSVQNIFFVGVGRLSSEQKGVVVASYAKNSNIDLDGVRSVLEQPSLNMSQGKHYNFNVDEVTWHLISGELI